MAISSALTLGTAEAQSKLSEAEMNELGEAMEQSDNGKADKAVKTLTRLVEAHPQENAIRYELGYALLKDYKYADAAATFHALRDVDGMSEMAYQMEGNALDMAGRRGDAVRTYKEGLMRHPSSGRLLMELGTIRMQEEDYDGALALYERGIEADPEFSSNYYRAAWLLFCSDTPEDGIAYGETYIIMAKTGDRVAEMSEMTYYAYATALRKAAMAGDPMAEAAKNSGYAAEDGDHPTLRAISAAKRARLEREAGNETEERLRNFERMVLEAGHWDAYCRWLTYKGNKEEFNGWLSLHEDDMENFALWIDKHGDRIKAGETVTDED